MSPLSLLLNRRFAVGRLCCWGGALAMCALGQTAQAQQAGSQPGRSPFLPQNWEQTQKASAPSATTDAAENGYVFNGMIQIGSRTLFSVSNAGTGQAMLLEIGDNSGPVQVLAYDERRNTVSLGNGGRTEELTLRKSDGEPLAVASEGRGQRGGAPGQSASGGNRGTDGQTRNARQIAWMEARRDRMNALIERRRAEMSGEGGGSGAVTVGGGNAANTNNSRTGNNNAAQRSGDNAVRQGTQAEGGQSRQGGVPRSRRLRSQMNP